VHNKIEAHFQFDKTSGLIVRHHDKADFWPWFEQAMGLKGQLLGALDKVEDATHPVIDIEKKTKREVREKAMAKLRSLLES
jgi:hypothetical protein